MRRVKLQNNAYYHVYNRGVDKRKVFNNGEDYKRFLTGLKELNQEAPIGSLFLKKYLNRRLTEKPDSSILEESGSSFSSFSLIKILAYCLLPNHYHLLLQQISEQGIGKYMQRIGISHTNYFNAKYKRSGYLFQGAYKCVPITTDDQLLYLSAYINGNAEIHGVAKAENWPWSSCLDYLDKRNGKLPHKKIVMDQFKNMGDYHDFLKTAIRESAKRKEELE
ncbi:hypothetical protein COX22_03775 [Candidatus Falkowbacteria bacterium CG23_combo_of_CG06-09_8_20_14_all_49_15]|uniref:Transposase IS200-like domain-containing protein n=1 Tax=Candidatus Falkowbacteria bacterium CG23_combo_of_CG06-09_8_20_14_all_49_15 TaxID=1974572 RepID=A0A2G9ZK49_9BACT|nr:MAG: hypothetical protein COX22_03775 [Candidatus Falkowbacteria bacterium CG23_combo_of_CG06-09_8_20_14_all_49_15]